MSADTKRAVESVVHAALDRAIASVGGKEERSAPKSMDIGHAVATGPEVFDPSRSDLSSGTYDLPSYADDGAPRAVALFASDKAVDEPPLDLEPEQPEITLRRTFTVQPRWVFLSESTKRIGLEKITAMTLDQTGADEITFRQTTVRKRTFVDVILGTVTTYEFVHARPQIGALALVREYELRPSWFRYELLGSLRVPAERPSKGEEELGKAGGRRGGRSAATTQPERTREVLGRAAAGQPISPEQRATAEKGAELLEKLRAELGAKEKVDQQQALLCYRLIFEAVKDPRFTNAGADSVIKFGRFLEENKAKVEGILQGNPPGKLTAKKIREIIDEYGRYIAAEPVEQGKKEGELESLADYEEEFKYDPAWQQLSKEDRKLLVEFAKMAPGEITDARIDFRRVTTAMKVSMALKLSWQSWPGEILEAAKAAFTDPTFILTLVLLIGIYVGLWLTPDPSFITKVAAGALTVALLAQFAYEDIYGLAKAWMELSSACAKAITVAEVRTAGERFANKVGTVGFDILMFIVMWRVGKRVGPRVQKHGLARSKAHAEARLAEAEAKPGGGKTPATKPEHAGILGNAKAKANSKPGDPSNATEVLDNLANSEGLSAEAKQGLNKFRTEMMKGKEAATRDANALKALESTEGKGLDLQHFLAEKTVTPEVRTALKAEILRRHAELTRLKMLEAETIKDPQVRKEAQKAIVENVKLFLHVKGVFKNPKLAEMVRTHNWKDLRAALGETAAREVLASDYAAGSGARVFGNLEVVRKIPEKSVAQYEAARRAAGLGPDPGKLRYRGNEIWGEVIGEIDALVAEPGGADGKMKPIELAEVKVRESGGMTGAEAKVQLAKKATRLDTIRTARPGEVVLTTRSGTKAMGADLTPQFDFSGTATIKQTTVGAAGKTGFTRELPYSNEVLAAVAESIAEQGLPPTEPKTIPPRASQTERPNEREGEELEGQH